MISSQREARLRSNIEKIEAYTARHPELATAHHWLYDSRYPQEGIPQFVVLGINPSETDEDWTRYPKPTEDTSRFDYHDRKCLTRAARNWQSKARDILGGADYVLAELFFWSSKDTNKKSFHARYGPLARSPHLSFCADLNRELIDAHQPRAVVAPGIGYASLLAKLHGLKHEETVRAANGHRLVERFSDGHRAWLVTKHWTGSFGFSAEEQTVIRDQVTRWG